MNTNNKRLAIGTALVLLLVAMAGRPEQAVARGSVYVGADPGGVVMVIDNYPRYRYYRDPGYVYSVEPRYRVPPPRYGWYRDYPPPRSYYDGHRRPHHHHHHDRWDRGRW